MFFIFLGVGVSEFQVSDTLHDSPNSLDSCGPILSAFVLAQLLLNYSTPLCERLIGLHLESCQVRNEQL